MKGHSRLIAYLLKSPGPRGLFVERTEGHSYITNGVVAIKFEYHDTLCGLLDCNPDFARLVRGLEVGQQITLRDAQVSKGSIHTLLDPFFSAEGAPAYISPVQIAPIKRRFRGDTTSVRLQAVVPTSDSKLIWMDTQVLKAMGLTNVDRVSVINREGLAALRYGHFLGLAVRLGSDTKEALAHLVARVGVVHDK